MNPNHVPMLMFAASLAAPLCAQIPAVAAAPAADLAGAPSVLPWPDRVLVDHANDGTLWAAAAGWKASFDAAGATFLPSLGADAPECAATFALRALRCAGEPLPLAGSAPTLADDVVSYDRGAARELFALAPNGVDHEFVITALPTRGELQFDVAIATGGALAAAIAGADADGHALRGPDGGVRYGAATAIDARGRSCRLATTWVGDGFRITVPEAFVAAAELPLVVDPLISTIHSLASDTKELLATDIAWDDSLGQFFISYERAYSASDHDVYVVVTDAAMAPQGLMFIDLTTENWVRPRIATLEAHDTGCVVAQTSVGTFAPFRVKARTFVGGASPLVQPVTLLSAGAYDYIEPDIGGDANAAGPTRFVVAYEGTLFPQTTDYLRCHLVDASGTIVSTANMISVTGMQARVAVSKTCGTIGGNTEGWALAFRYSGYLQSVGELRLAFFTRGGQFRTLANGAAYVPVTAVTPNAGNEWDVSSPTDHAEGRKVMTVETRAAVVGGVGAAYAAVFDWLGNTIVPDTMVAGGAVGHSMPAVETDGHRFAFADTQDYGGGDRDVRVRLLDDIDGQILISDNEAVSLASDDDHAPAICGMRGFGTLEFGLAWVHGDGTNWGMQAQRYRSLGHGFVVQRATACGPLQLGVTGTPTLGTSVILSLGNVTGIAGFLAGDAVDQPLAACPGCTLGVDGIIVLANPLLIAVPFDLSLLGARLSLQGLQLDPALGGCLGQFQLSNTVDLTVQ